jgi:hypothetical protein
MTKPTTFTAIIDNTPKFFETFAIDAADALSQLREIYGDDAEISIVLFRQG